MFPFISCIKQKIDFSKFRSRWRSKNQHNSTVAGGIFPIDHVSVGKYTYGVLNVYNFYPRKDEILNIGNYVSISTNVSFLLSHNHQIQTITSFPLSSVLFHKQFGLDATGKGGINIADEVWIGMNVIIMSGVTISKGAIVSAGSIVTHDIPPYAIVGGNPAKIIRYRFSQEIIRELLKVNLVDYPESFIKENINIFYEKIETVEDVYHFSNTVMNKINEKK